MVVGSNPTSATRPVGQAAKTPPFHGGNTSSILVQVTKTEKRVHQDSFFRFGDLSFYREVFLPKAKIPSSHSPLGDRQARLSGVERVNIRRRRNSRKECRFSFNVKRRVICFLTSICLGFFVFPCGRDRPRIMSCFITSITFYHVRRISKPFTPLWLSSRRGEGVRGMRR